MKINEKGHKKGCTCGFCRNLGSFGKKKKDDADTDEKDDKKPTAESVVSNLLDEG